MQGLHNQSEEGFILNLNPNIKLDYKQRIRTGSKQTKQESFPVYGIISYLAKEKTGKCMWSN